MIPIARVTEARLWPLRAPLGRPIKTSFGQMNSRPALLLCLIDEYGRRGWGEAWVNFPAWGLEVNTMALHALARSVIQSDGDPDALTESIFRRVAPQIVQSGQLGPTYQALSAINQALFDLSRQGITPTPVSIPVYASGIGPENVADRVSDALDRGFRDVKIKVGFEVAYDHQNFLSAQQIAGRGHVMVDANQAWTLATAQAELAWYVDHGARWVEEPVPALDFNGYDRLHPWSSHIAAGENWLPEYLQGNRPQPLIQVLQPDLAKIGGYWGARRLIDRLSGRFESVAFHVLGSPVNHAAALRGAGLLSQPVGLVEYDTNENPFNALIAVDWTIRNGCAHIGRRPGFGIATDSRLLERYVVPELVPWTHPLVNPPRPRNASS